MVAITKLILLASTVAASLIPLPLPGNGNDNQIIKDVTDLIEPKLTTLSNHIFAFPGSGATGAEEINKDANALIQAFNTTIADIKAGGFDVAQVPNLLVKLSPLVTKLTAMLVRIGENAPAWNKIQGPKLARQELEAGKTVLLNFVDALITAAPLIKPTAGPIKDTLTKAFDVAINLFPQS